MKSTAAKHGANRVKTRRTASPVPVAVEAMQLLGRWTRLSPVRLGSAMNCSCCIAAPGVKVGDFEHDILGYLHDKHLGAGTPGIVPLLEGEAGFKSGGGGSVGALLRALARGEPKRADETGTRALLVDLARCIESIEEQQRGIA